MKDSQRKATLIVLQSVRTMIDGLILTLSEGQMRAQAPAPPSNFPKPTMEALTDEEEDRIEQELESVRVSAESEADDIQSRWAKQRERFANPEVF